MFSPFLLVVFIYVASFSYVYLFMRQVFKNLKQLQVPS